MTGGFAMTRKGLLVAQTALVSAVLLVVGACGGTPTPSGGGAATSSPQADVGNVEFLSSQAQPVNEAEGMRRQVLTAFNGKVDFNSSLTGAQMVSKIQADHQAGKSTIDVVGDLHGDLVAMQNAGGLTDLTPLMQRLGKDRKSTARSSTMES